MTNEALQREPSQSSPHEISIDIHPFISAIERIAQAHGLHHDSGVSVRSATSSTRRKTKSTKTYPADQLQFTSPSFIEAEGSATAQLALPSSSTSGPASPLKRPSSAAPDDDARTKRVIESPGPTGEYDEVDEAWNDVTRRLKHIGDTLRHERLRTQLGDTELGKQCVGLLLYSAQTRSDSLPLLDAQVELMRIMGNLCIDHDTNREMMLKEGAPQAIIQFLDMEVTSSDALFDIDTLLLLRTAAGALLNMQLDHPSTREALRNDPNTLRTLLRLATDVRIYRLGSWYSPQGGGNAAAHDAQEWRKHISTGSSVATWAWRIVQDVCAGDEESQSNGGGSGDAKKSKSKEVDDEAEKTIESLIAIGALECAAYLVEPLEVLLSAADQPTVKGSWTGDDVSDLMESDMEIIQIAAELIESCALDSQEFRRAALDAFKVQIASVPTVTKSTQFIREDSSLLAFLVRFLDLAQLPPAWSDKERQVSDLLPPRPSDAEAAKEVEGTFARSKAALARGIVGIVGEDENMTKLFEVSQDEKGRGSWFVETMKEWMSRDPKQRDDLVSTAMLAVGNLARNDAHCVALVHEHNLVPTLSAVLAPTADINVSYGVICLLKNLAIPPSNKQIIGTSNDLIARLAPFLEVTLDKVQPLQFAAVGLLKHLCAGCLVNANDLVLKGTMDALLALLSRTDDVPTRMEGTRVLVNAIKTVWSSKASDTDTAALSESASNRSEVRNRLTVEPVVQALSDMVKGSTKYPVLVNEGILALTLLSSQREQEPSGPELVANALQVIRTTRQNTSTGDRAGDAQQADGEPTGEDDGLAAPRLPQRQTTLDTLASSTPQPLPAPRSGADMISTVLLRRDARMPPQFATNACVLVESLVQKASAKDQSGSSIVQLATDWQPALEHLSTAGPQETLPIAQRALASVQRYLA